MRKQGAQRKRSPAVQLGMCRRAMSRAIIQHKHLPGLDQAFAFVVVGVGRTAVGGLINPWAWEPADLLSVIDHWILNCDEWKQEDYPYSNNVDELSRKFHLWARDSGIKHVAALVGHPEGAATWGLLGPMMRQSFVNCLERTVQRTFKNE